MLSDDTSRRVHIAWAVASYVAYKYRLSHRTSYTAVTQHACYPNPVPVWFCGCPQILTRNPHLYFPETKKFDAKSYCKVCQWILCIFTALPDTPYCVPRCSTWRDKLKWDIQSTKPWNLSYLHNIYNFNNNYYNISNCKWAVSRWQ